MTDATHTETTIRTVTTDAGVLLFIDGKRYDCGNGQPFYFASVAGALRTAAEERELIEQYGQPTIGADDTDEMPF